MAFFDSIFNVVVQNMWIFAGIGILAFFIMTYLKVGSRIKYKVIDRREIERLQFIDDMRFNKTTNYKYFMKRIGNKGFRSLGAITHYLEFTHKGNPSTTTMIGMVVKPILFWKITNPFAKQQPVLLADDDNIQKMGNKLIIPEDMGIDAIFGFYYGIEKDISPKIENVIDYHLLKTDFNLQSSKYFVKSQEQCVYSPEMALELAKKEKEIQLELAKKRGRAESI